MGCSIPVSKMCIRNVIRAYNASWVRQAYKIHTGVPLECVLFAEPWLMYTFALIFAPQKTRLRVECQTSRVCQLFKIFNRPLWCMHNVLQHLIFRMTQCTSKITLFCDVSAQNIAQAPKRETKREREREWQRETDRGRERETERGRGRERDRQTGQNLEVDKLPLTVTSQDSTGLTVIVWVPPINKLDAKSPAIYSSYITKVNTLRRVNSILSCKDFTSPP